MAHDQHMFGIFFLLNDISALKALKAVIRFALEFKIAIYFRSSRYYQFEYVIT